MCRPSICLRSLLLRALVVTNMYPSERDPALGSFVRDQVEALRRVPGLEVELFAFSPGLLSYPLAARALRRRHGGDHFDVVHAHFGLTAWPARVLRGAPLAVTLHGTDLHHRALGQADPRRPSLRRAARGGLARAGGRAGRRRDAPPCRGASLWRGPRPLHADPARAGA